MIRKFLILTLAYPFMVLAHTSSDETAVLETWTLDQLCEQRERPAVWEELERRDVFDSREMRAIRKERLRTSIGPDAVTCFLGEPVCSLPYLVYPSDGGAMMVRVEAFIEGRAFDHWSVTDYYRVSEWPADNLRFEHRWGSIRDTSFGVELARPGFATGWTWGPDLSACISETYFSRRPEMDSPGHAG